MKKTTWLTPYRFEPELYERELRTIIGEIEAADPARPIKLDRILRKYPKDGKEYFSKSEIIQGYHHLEKPRRLVASFRSVHREAEDEAGADAERRHPGDGSDQAVSLPR